MMPNSNQWPDRSKPTTGERSQPAERRFQRCPFVANAEVTERSLEARRISARTSELGIGGCYIETPDPFSEGTLVQLRIFRGQGVFETKAKVVYSHSIQLSSGMGLAFKEMAPDQRSLLEDWLVEIVIQLRS
jgi:hypothetical protein